jgi:predicted hydrolase (HD superfamily)
METLLYAVDELTGLIGATASSPVEKRVSTLRSSPS